MHSRLDDWTNPFHTHERDKASKARAMHHESLTGLECPFNVNVIKGN